MFGDELIVLGLEREDLEAISFMNIDQTAYTKDLFTSSILDGKVHVDDERYKIVSRMSQTRKGKGRTKARRWTRIQVHNQLRSGECLRGA